MGGFPQAPIKLAQPFRPQKCRRKNYRHEASEPLKTVVLDCFMVSSCLSRWSFICQHLAVNARNRAKTTKIKSDILETPVILMPERVLKRVERWRRQGGGLAPRKLGIFDPEIEGLP